jgi:hypothetical protein
VWLILFDFYQSQPTGRLIRHLKERWNMTHGHANRLIDSAGVIDNLTPIGVKSAAESQARELARAEPEKLRLW